MKKETVGQDRNWFIVLLLFALFLLFIYLIFNHLKDDEDAKKVLEEGRISVVVQDKMAEKGLFQGISYYAFVIPENLDSTKESMAEASDEQLVEMSKGQFDALEHGELLEVFHVDKGYELDNPLDEKGFKFYIILILLLIYPLVFLEYWLAQLKLFKSFSLIAWTVGLSILILFLFWYKALGVDLINTYEKFYGKNYVETEATILGEDVYLKTGRMKSQFSYYHLYLFYVDEQGEVFKLKREVTGEVYEELADSVLPIKYKRSNPNQTFSQKTGFWDFMYVSSKTTFILYIVLLIVTFLLVFLFFMWAFNSGKSKLEKAFSEKESVSKFWASYVSPATMLTTEPPKKKSVGRIRQAENETGFKDTQAIGIVITELTDSIK